MRQNGIQTARARQLRKEQTPAEKVLWRMLRGRRLGGLKVRRQVPLGPYVVHFYCAELKLVIEAEDDTCADTDTNRCRDSWMQAQGLRVLRFRNRNILSDPQACAAAILGTTERLVK